MTGAFQNLVEMLQGKVVDDLKNVAETLLVLNSPIFYMFGTTFHVIQD